VYPVSTRLGVFVFPSFTYPRHLAAVRSGPFLRLTIVLAAYFLGGKIGLAIPFTSGNVSPVWPPAGIALAALLVWGYGMWPAVLAGAFLVNFFSPVPHAASLGIAVGNSGSALVTVWLLRKIPGFRSSLPRLQDVLALVLLGGLSTAIAATAGVASLNLAGVKPWSGFTSAWLIWWLGDAMGVIVVAPLILSLSRLARLNFMSLIEFTGLAVAAFGVAFLVFGHRFGLGAADNVLVFLVFPFVIFAAIRFDTAGAAVVSALVAAVAIWETAIGLGPFVQPNPIRGATLLQVFLAVISISGLALAAVVAEREAAQGALLLVQDLARHRERAEQALRSSEQRLSGIVNSAMDGIITVDRYQRIVLFNSAAESIFRCPAADAIGRDLDHFIPARFREAHRRHIQSFGETGVTNRSMSSPGALFGVRAGGEEFPIEATISQVESEGQKLYTVILRDVTLRRQAEEALVKSEKLASAGRLAATIAHEINNPLAAVTNLLYLARSVAELPETIRRHLDLADTELQRVAHITKQTLGFYREHSAPVRFDPAVVLDSVLALLQTRIEARSLAVDKRYQPNLQVLGSHGEIRQVFSNVISNSIDALQPGGRLQIKIASSPDWRSPANRGVRITVADTGHGIAPGNLARIFEPFFTTKKDTGTGLGLWVSRQIVDKHAGSIRVRSRTGPNLSGTVFSIFLPVAAASEQQRQASAS
jgi:PAS domain S-box-containing protein